MEHFKWISASIIIIISCAISMMILADVHWRTLTRKKQLTVLIYFIIYLFRMFYCTNDLNSKNS